MAEIPVRFELDTIAASLPILQAAARTSIPLNAFIEEGGSWRPLVPGERWGAPGRTVRIRIPLRVPDGWDGDIVLHAVLGIEGDLTGPEALAYLDGVPFQGLDRYHHDLLLTGHVAPGSEHEVMLEAYSSLLPEPPILTALTLQHIQPEADALYHDVRVLLAVVPTLPAISLDRAQLTNDLVDAYRAIDLRRPGSDAYLASVRSARAILRRAFERPQGPEPSIVAVGHAHIDLAWLWPVSQTRRKAARTFSTVLRLMERYPDFRFVASQPALYRMLKEDEPKLYAQVLDRIREGRWEPIGATWVEMDTNLAGAEALVRQFLFGKRFFRQELGVDPRVAWLPDTFGYSTALPQIMRGAGVDSFMTTKISWNEYNRLPYDTFHWHGLDGTPVLAHMVTAPMVPSEEDDSHLTHAYTYNAMFTPADLAGEWAAYREKRLNHELLYLFGYGDGGGGPTATMLETARRLKHLAGFPRVEQSSAEQFFRGLNDRLEGSEDLPRWIGELYLEYHRGTYTSQAWIKRANRQAEILYREAELWSSWAGGDRATRQTAMNIGWEGLLFHQFHDILPGSSIGQVYADARRAYPEIMARGEQIRDASLASLEEGIARDADSVILWNPAPFDREEPVEVCSAVPLPRTQAAGDNRYLIPARIPAHGYTTLPLSAIVAGGSDLTVAHDHLENRFFRIELAEDGTIRSLVDKRVGRELIAPGAAANVLIAFEDRPLAFDAWDIQIDYQAKPYPITDLDSRRVVEEGPLRGAVELVRRYGESTIRQRVVLYRDVARIDFPTEIDWHEHQTLLKASFPVAINAQRATYDIQFGNVERPAHWNTSWDWARFEVPAHKWADISEGDYGVSLLNDSKYGYDVKGNVLRLTLLKSAVSPDPEADQGLHRFAYALFPHTGDWRAGETVRQAYLFNMRATGRAAAPRSGPMPAQASFVRTDRPGLVIETVKPAENGDGIVVRVYDAYNTRGTGVLEFAHAIVSAEETNLLEEPIGPAEFEGTTLTIPVRPYGIATYRVRLS
ncbi:MAG TPA: alpha-mannosidase [Chloroflexota bacterium]|nr:alpha-mannosidase [Chloroflexota bacterium]